ncbi:hypothetical protein Tco_0090519 [Tanacetum coccineum]
MDDPLRLGRKNGSRFREMIRKEFDEGLLKSKQKYPFDYRVTLGFGSISGGLDPVSPVIRLPIERGINSGTRIGQGIRASRCNVDSLKMLLDIISKMNRKLVEEKGKRKDKGKEKVNDF